jgi:hypothetical protein
MSRDIIIVGTDNLEKMLYVIGQAAMTNDNLEIRYVQRYAPTVEYLLRLLRKGFGWLEIDRGEKDVVNQKCRYNVMGKCTEEEQKDRNIICKEGIRTNCKKYILKSDDLFHVNYVIIEKAGGIRGL